MQNVAKELNSVLASTYMLYIKTHSFHWNVTGANFKSLHELFEEQYDDLAEAADTLAERIRALGFAAPAGLKVFQKLSQVHDVPDTVPDAETMLKLLADDNEKLNDMLQQLIETAQEHGDEVTADMAIERQQQHQKNIWMLESSLPAGKSNRKLVVA